MHSARPAFAERCALLSTRTTTTNLPTSYTAQNTAVLLRLSRSITRIPALSANGLSRCRRPCRNTQQAVACLKTEDANPASTQLTQNAGRSLPVALLVTIVACQCVGVRHGTRTAEAILLLLEVTYAGLHLHPLVPLLQHRGKPDLAFMQSYTRPVYFISECWLLAWLLQTPTIQAKVPIAVLAGHGAVHVLFVLLAGVAADWAMQQQVQRIQNGWNVVGLSGIWHTMVNLVNFADLALHCWYIAILWQSMAHSADLASSFTGLLPTGLISTGVLISYIIAVLLPQWLYDKQSQ